MKTKQTKIDRSAAKWLPGAMALAATTASTQAATVQITLTGNMISSLGGNQLVADLTGDGVDDMTILWHDFGSDRAVVQVQLGGLSYNGLLRAFRSATFNRNYVDAAAELLGVGFPYGSGFESLSRSYLNRVTFTDSRINGGAPTGAWLQVNAFNTSATNHTVELSRLIFDDANTTRPGFTSIPGVQADWQVSAVPEASTSLGLLALGAGGILTRRRTKRAA